MSRVRFIRECDNYILHVIGIFLSCLFALFLFSENTYASNDCSSSISTTGDIQLNLIPGIKRVTTHDVAVDTDCRNGYSLYISSDQDAMLYAEGDSSSSNYISPVSGTKENPTTLSNDTYGYALGSSIQPDSNNFIGLTGELALLGSVNHASAEGGDSYTVSYGALVRSDKLSGDYFMTDNGGVIYTVITNDIENTVTFDANGGTIPAGGNWAGSGSTATKLVFQNALYGPLPTPTRPGYSFLGWNILSDDMLPDEYQRVEYIESTGTQYINTDIVPTNATGVHLKVSSSNVVTDYVYYGSSDSSKNARFWIGNENSKVYYGWNGLVYSDAVLVNNETHEIEMNYLNDRKYKLDGTEIGEISGSLGSQNTFPIYIFAGNRDGEGTVRASNIKLYEFRISENNIVHDFIPCYRKSDDVIGLYDTYNNTFYTNNGTGEFNKGEDINNYITASTTVTADDDHTLYAIWRHNPTVTFNAEGGTVSPASKTYTYDSNYTDLPTPERSGYTFRGWVTDYLGQDYIKYDYISSDGSQFINTNLYNDGKIIPTNTIGVYVKLSDADITGDTVYFGSRRSTNLRYWIGSANGRVYFGWNSNTAANSRPAVRANRPYVFELNYLNSRVNRYIAVNYSENITTTFDGSNSLPIAIFGGNDGGTVKYKSSISLYEFKISDNSTIIHDLVPCYRLSDGVIGLYDTIGDVFYTNNGTGTFGAGTDVFVDGNTAIKNNQDHTLHAIWEEE